MIDQNIIGVGYFITSTTPDYRLAHVEEICGYLSALQSIDKLFANKEDATQIDMHIASNCLLLFQKLEKDSKVVNISNKLHPIIR